MSENVVIVESPAKTKTLTKYLGKGFTILASYGHVRDLIPKTGAIDVANDFAMQYALIDKNAKHVDTIKKALKKAKNLYLATDPDREGEAISWHLYEILKDQGVLEGKKVHRIAFNEITQSAVQAALAVPRTLSMNLVNAQQARRALDYLVGFNLSPLLWKKVKRGLSAGRVQSPALRLITEREIEIEKFVKKEYWSITASLLKDKTNFSARLLEFEGTKQEQFSITQEKEANQVQQALLKASHGVLEVTNIKKSERKRNPTAPFITSTLQQEASRKLGFTTQRTMRTAQQLYEGVDIGSGEQGLITYMRTDSVVLSKEALGEIREFIVKKYGQQALSPQERVYKTKAKNAQEAHEAIRPTTISVEPEAIKSRLSVEQYKLYSLIWKRALASQMASAVFDAVACDLKAGDKGVFRANGSTLKSPGFLQVYEEGVDDAKDQDKDAATLPPLDKGEKIPLEAILPEQHFTEPPPRYTEASLVKALEEFGIGRPSTYAAIISTLKNREYVTLDKKRFQPTDIGRIVNKFLTQYFGTYVDYHFTANLEDALDAISRGEKEWVPILEEFWQPFKDLIDNIEETVQRKDVTQEEINEKCPECQKPLAKRLGKAGFFIGCTGYPDCSYTRNVDGEETDETINTEVGRDCEKCLKPLVYKRGRYGKFIGCSGYPKCKFIESVDNSEKTGVSCPHCQKGEIVKKRSRYGSFFYACNAYPDCKYAMKFPPIEEACPECKWPIMGFKTTKKDGEQKVCPQKTCGHISASE